MIVTEDNQRLYFTSWNYNAARIMTALAKVVLNHGGKVKPTNRAIISNRQLDRAIKENEQNIQNVEGLISKHTTEGLVARLSQLWREGERYHSLNNTPITVTHTSYITFVLDNVYYYYQFDDNPFSPFLFSKTPIKNNRRSLDACLEEAQKDWLYDCFFGFDCANTDCVEAANLIFNELVNHKNSVIRLDQKKVTVPNKYSDGYHTETIYCPERFEPLAEWAQE